MPAVNVAMQRSLREGFEELLLASLRPALERRMDIQGEISDAKTAFSSWDNCMQASFCKWPVIAIIIIGGLIIFSVVWCIIRCACCGLSCCCSCFSCLKCCGDCCGCCDPPRGKRSKYLDEPYIPPNQGYQKTAPMTPFAPAPALNHHAMSPTFSSMPAAATIPPQYAEFDVSKKPVGEDALPAMPTWDDAGSKKIAVEEAVEMDQLKKKPEAGSAQNLAETAGAAGAAGAVAGTALAGPRASPVQSPVNRSPYGPPGPAPGPGSSGYFAAPGAVDNDPYAQNGHDYHQPGGGAFGQAQGMGPDQGYGGPDQGYGLAVAGPGMGPGRRSPRAGGGGYNDGGYGPPARQGSYDTYGNMPPQQNQPYDNYNDNYNSQSGGQGYGMGPGIRPRRSPRDMQMGGGGGPGGYGQPQDLMRRSPSAPAEANYGAVNGYDRSPSAPAETNYGAGRYDNRQMPPSRQYSSDSQRPLRGGPTPRRQYSHDVEPTLPPIPAQDFGGGGGGFDFNTSGYSRPNTGHGNDNSYRQPSPAAVMPELPASQPQQQQASYPGYKPYQPPSANNGGSGGGGQQQGQSNWSGL
ncbi:hypothetical protein B0H66DRAFT_11328 [Apodospora peruviana]|uniref:Fibroin-3 related protein n=1 Tax=Apodospora peruviana TaxID=516989 RepID=A0AAE0ME38_9PEZI|nr:hypothetical protein B0H66DRAFT_11328 [Apodospora peruviana]